MAKKVLITRFPDAATVSYSRAIEKMITALGAETLKIFEKYIVPQLTTRQDAEYTEDGILDGIKKMFYSLRDKANKIFTTTRNERAASSFVKSVNRFNRHNIEQQMKVKGIGLVATEPWLKDFMRSKVVDNVGYIKTIQEDYFDEIESIVHDGVKDGASIKHIREQLINQVDISKNKAQFIAVDQAGSILGQMTAQRHQNIGIEKFEWYDAADERVRDSHRKLSGETFSYSDPPEVNGRKVLPGEDYRCRCVALPVFDDEEEEDI
ncbi:SPP1 gp7 family putative phage head morphogenesis protein [Lysinibacillus parviboronicapiens]|uniref:SPP1 gp7 family putative phage head morphogenesis protein n=1 Tax=Lysinibacillus parviboronicapiens TaxID=436516 RepID=A0ABV2PMK7_9BACI